MARLRFLATIATLCLVLCAGAAATADEPEPISLTMRCDRAGNRLEFVVTGYAGGADQRTLQTIEAGSQRDCTLADGTQIRLRAARAPVRSIYGHCSLSPPYFFSLWVNRRKVISADYEFCGELALRGILVDGRIVRHCWYDRENAPDQPYLCAEHPVPRRDAGRDYVEYPPVEASRIAATTRTGLVASANPRLCNAWTAARTVGGPPPGSEAIAWQPIPGITSSDGNSWAQPPVAARFDFDNDGQTDEVWQVEDRSRGFYADYYILVPPGSNPTQQWLSDIYAELNGTRRGTARFTMRSVVPEAAAVYGGHVSVFGDPEVTWQVFRFEGRTYVLGTPWYDRVRHIVAEPHAGRLRTVCIFDRPREHF